VSGGLKEARDCGAMLDIAGFTASASRAARASTAAGIVEGWWGRFQPLRLSFARR
jgi:hypothetical protein